MGDQFKVMDLGFLVVFVNAKVVVGNRAGLVLYLFDLGLRFFKHGLIILHVSSDYLVRAWSTVLLGCRLLYGASYKLVFIFFFFLSFNVFF